ncbi:hypothetical protein DZF91_22315 [Actinomadura logoneensis]|uniref:Uncharacterized protein n=1 Tax=Actinomadura logoneensis TaxID=2293572 RepID=A0A372JJD6_9ACTN|nr:hypothetical protein [Actinomadura logoneensis]RFU39408.1 hypothetical protein DZF91_22315 [Actinomadura logoneensis]
MSATGRPTLDEIEERFVELVASRLSRDEADRWAASWVARDGIDWDDLSWWALDLLHGIDLPAGGTTGGDLHSEGDLHSGGYLHSDAQVRAWLTELRRRRAR